MKRGIFLWTICVAIFTGCATSQPSGGFKQLEHIAEYNGEGDGIYYRISVAGGGTNGVVKYRSGWYPANAVDALFGNVGEEITSKATTAARQRRAIEQTFNKYMEALEKDEQFEKAAEYKAKYEEVLKSVSGLADAGSGPAGALDHADDKFVMVIANDPDQIIEAIRGKTQSMDVAGAITKIISSRGQTQTAKSSLKLNSLIARLEALKGSLSTAKENLPATATNEQLIQELDVLIAEVEAAR